MHLPHLIEFCDRISGSGWYLLPKSLSEFKKHSTVWLARPGVPVLVEVIQRKTNGLPETADANFVSQIEVPLPENKPQLATIFGLSQFQASPESSVFMTISGIRNRLEDIIALENIISKQH